MKGTLEVPDKDIDSKTTRGWASAPFRLYKAYLTLRAIAADPRAWRAENVAQIMRNLFKGKVTQDESP